MIQLQGAANVRDFSEIKNREGRKVRGGCFIRSCHLNDLTTEDIEKLEKEYHLQKIIDLRTSVEAAQKPDAEIPGAVHIHVPIFDERAFGITYEKEEKEQQMDKMKMLENLPSMSDLYRKMVTDEYCVNQFRKVLNLICETADSEGENGAVLWHCTEGKDRCGITSALFLALLDVDYDTIMEDYLRTNAVPPKEGERYYQMILAMTKDERIAESIRRFFRAEEEYLDAAFDAIKETYGSVDSFIRDELQISDEVKEKMKERYLL